MIIRKRENVLMEFAIEQSVTKKKKKKRKITVINSLREIVHTSRST